LKPYSSLNVLRIRGAFFFPLLLLLFLTLHTYSQVVNGYAEVTGIAGSVLTVASANESADSFEDGEYVVIIQMQDDVIGDVSNTSSFGDLGSIVSAGLYEIRQISSHTESGGVPTSITISGSLTNTYNTGSNSHVQVVTFPTFGSPDYTTTSTMAAADWDGTTGGILAFNVDGTLTLAHSLNADEAGFRGGARDLSSSGSCDVTTFFSTNTNAFAGKGEGIYRNTNSAYEEAKGKILNGGGGGNEHNGGGGGGGGYSAGGDSGPGWNCGSGDAGGIGGIALDTYIDAGRVFLGGGGGGGEGNNSVSTDGGDGGGIILVSASTIRTSGSCGGISISANGASSASAGNDGAGGGGAGGCIVIDVNVWDIASTCPISVSSNGGSGGSVGSPNVHGGGGGGGQGAVIYSIARPTSNTTTSTDNGNGGCNNTSSPCNSVASSGANISGTGIIDNTQGPLPIELLNFQAYRETRSVQIVWSTASETDNDFFEIERSSNGKDFYLLTTVPGAGNSREQLDYYLTDFEPLSGTSYYRLKQVDFDGTYSYSPIARVTSELEERSILYPNPSDGTLKVTLINRKLADQQVNIRVISAEGATIIQQSILADPQGRLTILPGTGSLPRGMYFVSIESREASLFERLVIQ